MGALPEEIRKKYGGKTYKIVVGIPSYNNEDTIKYVAETAAKGVKEFFDGNGVLVNSDGGSKDKTKESFLSADVDMEKVSFEYIGVPGKGSAIRSIFEFADLVNADVIVFLDSDLRSVEPWWVERLAGPILNGRADYVTPYYIRHKYDSTITNHICYPLTSSLYGMKVRQPIGGDFGVGRNVYKIYLKKPEELWQSNVARFGIDIWMTTTAIVESGKVYQAALGAKVHDVKDPGKHLGPMFLQVVSTLFELMDRYESIWRNVSNVKEAPIYGKMPNVKLEEITVDLENLKKKASEGVFKYKGELQNFLSIEILESIIKNGVISKEQWVDAVYRFASYYKRNKTDETVKMMIPFYFARVASFVEETSKMSTQEAENIIESQLETFMEKKRLLLEIF